MIRLRQGVFARSAVDDAIVQRLRARDVLALEELYKAYHPKLTRFILNIVRRAHLVEEVYDDTMMVVWTRTESFNGGSRLSTWVYGIAYRTALSALRRVDDPQEDVEPDALASEAPGPDIHIDRAMTGTALARVLRTLSPVHRAVVDLTYGHEMSYSEIAEVMMCPVDTVKTRMFHARRQLRRALGGEASDWIG